MTDPREHLLKMQKGFKKRQTKLTREVQECNENLNEVWRAAGEWLAREEEWKESEEGKAALNKNVADEQDIISERGGLEEKLKVAEQLLRGVDDALKAFP
jgi:hypothetical protein